MSNKTHFPKTQRALVLQGGGALGAYEAGAFRALYDSISENDGLKSDSNTPLFDIVAGTSSGAINAAILVSYVKENKKWEGSAEHLCKFWRDISSNPNLSNWWPFSFDDGLWVDTWNERHNNNKNAATGEAARRYYSAKEFLYSGADNVFSKPNLEYDNRFFDEFYPPVNLWYKYDNQPLKKSLRKVVAEPIATSFDENSRQPRLLMVSVDVLDSTSIVFDSFAKKDGRRFSEYKDDNSLDDEETPKKDKRILRYDNGIVLDHVIASASVPINYDYTILESESAPVKEKNSIQNTNDDNVNRNNNKSNRYFWDGGMLSNTPLRELIHAHRDYWLKIREEKDVSNLDIYIIDVHPPRQDDISFDRDGAINRNLDITYHNRNLYDIQIANLVSDYIDLANSLKDLATKSGAQSGEITRILNKRTKSSPRSKDKEKERKYKNLLEGRFSIENVTHIERKNKKDDDTISNKAFDFSTQTINQLIDDGYNDAKESLNRKKKESTS